MENKFSKTHAYKDLIISGIILILGIVLIYFNTVLGIIIIAGSLLSFLFYKSGYRYDNQRVLLHKKSLEISRKCQQSILDFLNGNSSDLTIVPGNEGGTLLLEVWYNKQENIAYAQLFVYQELVFQKITDLIHLQSTNAQKLIEQL
ncbi:MAG: hypothetical protein IKP54_10480 [Bacteroidales bacterium]|nr:hypothetical protein [Bacteroidales bacterium]